MTIECRHDAFQVGVRARAIGTGSDAFLRFLADVPVLAVRFVPEVDGWIGAKICQRDRVLGKEEVASHPRSVHVDSFDTVRQNKIRMRAEH